MGVGRGRRPAGSGRRHRRRRPGRRGGRHLRFPPPPGLLDPARLTPVRRQTLPEPFSRRRAMRHLETASIVLLAGGIGQPYVTPDYPAVQRALELDADALLVAKRGVDGVYDSDPNVNPNAVRYERLTYDEALAAGVRVMDTSAFVLANEQGLTMHVFDVAAPGAMREICAGSDVGTRISAKA